MTFSVSINIMPQKEILDPQGKAVKLGLANLNLTSIADVRIGKHIDMVVEASSEAAAHAMVEEACQKLLANLIMESYSIEIKAA
jgi:phosphoribosylformylglycinamidine synthase subunit PurS